MTNNTVDEIKPLTLTQYHNCKDTAKNRIYALNGHKPTKKGLAREQLPLTNLLDWLALIVFFAAFIVSSLHILEHVGSISENAYQISESGLLKHVNKDFYIILSQIGMVFLAEASMLLFMTRWYIETKGETNYLKCLNVSFVLSIMAMVFVLYANFKSGLSVLEAMLPPFFTIGLGFQLEQLIANTLERQLTLDKLYHDKLSLWEIADENPEKHQKYANLLKQEVWDRVSRLKANESYRDSPNSIKLAAVNRELDRDNWLDEVARVEEKLADVSNGKSYGELPEKGIDQLYLLVKESPLAKGSTLEVGDYGASLDPDNLHWWGKGERHGPYVEKRRMLAAIKMIGNKESNKND